ncbi:helix-turn-helix domain-containing protein [Lederbergia galactosidilytica]|uniref:helix-turn-helix domain-containing protein n=1 Tax=Lederbergia galactosidilytica TaxID=217031 RepID=UPI00071737EC|nr:AraC family transcriptional regulator [Lederbergia galactosidilytica]
MNKLQSSPFFNGMILYLLLVIAIFIIRFANKLRELGESLVLEHVGKKHESFGFRFQGDHQNEIVGIHTLGWENVKSTDYHWDGITRREVGKYVFQYTLSGRGMIEMDGKLYPLTSGKAFLVALPSRHRYFLPNDSEHWEFIYITLYGKEAEKAFRFIHEEKGRVINFPPESELIQLLLSIYQKAVDKDITDAFQASALSYAFMMELYRFARNLGAPVQQWPEQIVKAALFAQNHYDKPIGLDDLVEASGLSKYHFTRLFHKTTSMTPLNYLTKIRLDKAMGWLRSSDKSIQEIARLVGYSNGNYFSKVFHKRIGMSPGQFRESKYTVPVDHIVVD